MRSSGMCADCFKGVRHEGESRGKFEQIAGTDCYIIAPEGEYATDTAILFLTDAYGIALKNNQLLADDFANNGFQVIMPDLFNGDACAPDAMSNPNFNPYEWVAKHTQEITRPGLNKVLAALKEQGITTLAAAGYCFGGRYVFDLGFDNVIKVAVASHPSLLQIPDDLERYAREAKVPLLLNTCEVDRMFGKEAQDKADELLGSGNFAPGFKRNYFDGCTHGFCVRGDLSNPKVKYGKEETFKATVEWFKLHL